MTMAQITTLKDRDGGGTLYPVTSTTAVFDPQGRDLETRLAAAPGNTVTKEEFDRGLAAKQGKLTTTNDLRISPANELSLTDLAKAHLLCDLFTSAALGRGYARITNGTFECRLNDLDLTYEEAVEIYRIGNVHLSSEYCFSSLCRTFLPPKPTNGTWVGIGTWSNCRNAEVIDATDLQSSMETFAGCTKLREVRGFWGFQSTSSNIRNMFKGCTSLETVMFDFGHGWSSKGRVVDFHDCPKLSLATFRRMVDTRSSSSNFTDTVTVHPDVYAKLTGDTSNAAAAALPAGELAQWQQLLADATAKDITFATTT